MTKKILTGLAAVGFLTTYATAAMASTGFEKTVNVQLGNGANVSCNACHNGGTSTATATFPMAGTYRAARTAGDFTLLATSDSDGDGYINKFEVNIAATEFNDKAISPFTKVTAVNTDINIKALADTGVVSATFADPQGLAATGKEILGGVKVTLNQADTIYFKAGGVSSTDTIYTVDATGVGTAVAAADWAATVDGGLQIKALPAGATTADYVAVRAVPVAATAAVTNGIASVTGCISSSLSTPLMMVLALLSLGFFVRRKKVNE